MLQQERAEALDLVVDAILAERPPIDAGVDREHGLVEPEKSVDFIQQYCRMSHSYRVDRALNAARSGAIFAGGIARASWRIEAEKN